MQVALIIPSFVAGLLTFLAPCTLPLVPGYLGFISGVSLHDLKNPTTAHRARRRIFLNGLLYIIGFSAVFIVLGSLVGLGGAVLSQYRVLLGRIGGVFIIFFGLYMMNTLKFPIFSVLGNGRRLSIVLKLKPGTPASSLVLGASFAFGWTPCVGPILGSVLVLAAASATVGQGAFLLFVFSLGLAVPFLGIAAGFGSAAPYLDRLSRYFSWVSAIGGAFLVFIGVLLVTNRLGLWISYFFQLFGFINYDRLLDFL